MKISALIFGVFYASYSVAVTFYIPEIRPILLEQAPPEKKKVSEEVNPDQVEGGEAVVGESGDESVSSDEKPSRQVNKYDPNFSKVILSGKAQPGDRIRISKKKIPYITKDNKIMLMARDKVAMGAYSVKANSDGYFELHLRLPHEQVQIPVSVRHNKEKRERFQLQLTVAAGNVVVEDEDSLEQSPELRSKFGLWLGVGYNYLSYSQDSISQNIDVSYESFKGPTIFAQGMWWLSDIWQFSASYKSSPGSVSGTAESTILGGDYDWTIASFHATYYALDWRPKVFKKYKSRIGMIFGIQYHTVPFLARVASGAGEVRLNTVAMAVGGGKILIDKGKGWAYEVFMRMQYPILVGDVFDISYRMAFDGSVGTYYNFQQGNLKFGVFWYGQYHQYAFTHFDESQSLNITGNEALFFSTLEGRVGYSF